MFRLSRFVVMAVIHESVIDTVRKMIRNHREKAEEKVFLLLLLQKKRQEIFNVTKNTGG